MPFRKFSWAEKQKKRKKCRVPGFKDRCYPTPIATPIPAWNQQTLAYYALQRLRGPIANSAGCPVQLTMQSLQEAGEELTGPKGIFRAHRNEAVSGGYKPSGGVLCGLGKWAASNLSGTQTSFLCISVRLGNVILYLSLVSRG